MTTSEIKYWLLDVMQHNKVYNVTQEQADQIKEIWEDLHTDSDMWFSFNEGCSKIKKYDYRKPTYERVL